MASLRVKGGTRPPWVGLGAAVWVQIAAGNAYNFPPYSHSLKSVLGFNQHQLTITMLGVANDIGESVGLVPGLASNNFPPWLLLLIGALACFFGYGVLWLAPTRTLNLPYWLLWLALCIATNSNAWFTTAVLVTNMRNFPLNRGTVAGILKGHGGLSAAVFTQIYSLLLHTSSSSLLLFLAIGIPVLCFIMMFLVRPCTPASVEEEEEAQTRGVSGLLAGYVYDKEEGKQRGLTFLVQAGVCCVGSLLSVVLTVRIRPVYQMLYKGGSFRYVRCVKPMHR